MTRLPLALLVVFAAGCGPLRPALAPSLVSIPRLAPDVVPEQGGSSVVVTASAPGRGVTGRVLDRDTGAALAGIALDVTDADGIVTSIETDIDGAFRAVNASGISSVTSYAGRGARVDLCHAWLDARPTVDAGREASIVVLLAPAAC